MINDKNTLFVRRHKLFQVKDVDKCQLNTQTAKV